MHGECLEEMAKIPDGSIDMILTDPPYGTIKGLGDGYDHGMVGKCSWDDAIDPDSMLASCDRILRANGALALFSQEPYTSQLIAQAKPSSPFSYRLTWLKDHFANALIARKSPVSYTEDILVYFKKHTKHDFDGAHPLRAYAKIVHQFIGISKRSIAYKVGTTKLDHFFRYGSTQFSICTRDTYEELAIAFDLQCLEWFKSYDEMVAIDREFREKLIQKMTNDFPKVFNLPEGKKFKSNVLEYKKDYSGHHPTQKPVALLEDLIKTYTNEGDTVLDFTMGSGSTGVACMNTGRNFIGIERDDKYFKIANDRIVAAAVALCGGQS